MSFKKDLKGKFVERAVGCVYVYMCVRETDRQTDRLSSD